MSIERDRRLKTTLYIYGDILCAIRETACTRRSLQCSMGDIGIVKLGGTVHVPTKLSESSASHIKRINSNTQRKST
jgi:hypothetical protein